MQDTLIIDTSNAHCGPGSLPGLRLSEGRYSHRSDLAAPARALVRGWRLAGRPWRLRPPKSRRSLFSFPFPPPSRFRRTSPSRTVRAAAGGLFHSGCPRARVSRGGFGRATGRGWAGERGRGGQRARAFCPDTNATSDQTRRPAEFKHITKRRKRN